MRKIVLLVAAVAAALSAVAHAAPAHVSSVPQPGTPEAVAVDPVTKLVYVAVPNADVVSVIAGAGSQVPAEAPAPGQAGTAHEIARIPVEDSPRGVAADGRFVYVSNFDAGSVSVIAGTTVVDTLDVGPNPWGLAADVTTNRLCVAVRGLDQVLVYDTTTLTLVRAIVVGSVPVGVAADRGRCYVTSNAGGTVQIIDLSTSAVSATVQTVPGNPASGPYGVAADPLTGLVWVANAAHGSVSIVDPLALTTQVVPIGAGTAPTGVAASGRVVYVTAFAASTVALINPVTKAFVVRPVGVGPVAVATWTSPALSSAAPLPGCAATANFVSESVSLLCDVV